MTGFRIRKQPCQPVQVLAVEVHRLVFSALFCALTGFYLSAAACNWLGGTGNWSDPAKWSCGEVPGAGDDVIIPDGVGARVNMDVSATVNSLFFAGIDITGSNTLTVNSQADWENGDVKTPLAIAGGGALNIENSPDNLYASLAIESGATVNQSASFVIQTGGSVLNQGIFSQSSGFIQFNNPSVTFSNDGTFNASHSGTLISGGGTFNNTGTFNKNGGSGSASITAPFINGGAFHHSSGSEIIFNNITQNGTFSLNAGATFTWRGGTVNSPVAIPSGATLKWDSGNLATNAAMIIDGTFSILGGGTMSGSGSYTANGTMNWNAGTFNLPLTIGGGGVLNIGGNADSFNKAWTVSAGGTVFQTKSYTIQAGGSIANNGTYNNQTGFIQFNSSTVTFDNNGTFNASHDGTIVSGAGTFNNNGTFNINGGSGTSTIGCKFNNGGSFVHAAGNRLQFNNILNQNFGSSFSINSGATLVTNGSTTFAGVDFYLEPGQTWELYGPLAILQIGVQIEGDFRMDANINGPGFLQVVGSGEFFWLDDDLSASVTCFLGGTAWIAFTGNQNLCGSINADNESRIYQSVNATVNFCPGAGIANNGIYGLTGSAPSSTLFTGNGTYENESTFVNGADAAISINSGFVNGASGTLEQTQPGGVLNFGGGFTNEGRVSGIGSMIFSSIISWTGVTAPGNSPGILAFNTFDNSNGTLEIELAGAGVAGTDYDQLKVTGAGTLAGTLDIFFLNGFIPQVGNTFTIMTCNPCSIGALAINYPGAIPNAFSVAVADKSIVLRLEQTLPVELLSFQALDEGESVLLRWATATEHNNKGFELQRSADGMKWEAAAFLKGAGNSLEERRYEHQDRHPLPGLNYYRLKQIDYDGQFEYSKVVSVYLQRGRTGALALYPNPWKEGPLQLRAPGLEGGIWSLFDTKGRLLWRRAAAGTETSLELPRYSLPPGLYTVQVRVGAKVLVERLLVF